MSRPNRMIGLLGCLALAATSLWAIPRAHAADVSASIVATLCLKIMSFDEGLKKRAGSTIVVGVLYTDTSMSAGSAADLVSAFKSLSGEYTVHSKAVSVTKIAYGSDLEARLKNANVSALFVTAGIESEISAIAKATESLDIPTFCGSRDQLTRGLAVAIVTKNSKPSIVINLSGAAASGMELDPKLLRLAEIVK